MSQRVIVYQFANGQEQAQAALRMYALLQKSGLHPQVGCEPVITLPPEEAEILKQLQRDEPDEFGGC